MGLGSLMPASIPSPEDERAAAIRSGAAVLSRAERTRCWESRDALFACLNAHGIVDTTRDAEGRLAAAKCPTETATIDVNCPVKWVVHFRQKFVVDKIQNERLKALEQEGAVRVDVKPDFKATAGVRGTRLEKAKSRGKDE